MQKKFINFFWKHINITQFFLRIIEGYFFCGEIKYEQGVKNFELIIICTANDIIIKGSNEYTPSAKSNKNAPNHGYGQKIISSIAKKYNGSYKSEISNGKFITNTILENKVEVWLFV